MATGHWLTTRGKLKLMQGDWDDMAAGIVKVGLMKVQGTAADTVAEVENMVTVTDLIVTAGCTECDFTNYARKVLARTNWAEDVANDRVNAVHSLLTWALAGGALNNTVLGAFFYDSTVDTNDTTRILYSVDWFATGVPTNGGDWRYDASAGFYRAA